MYNLGADPGLIREIPTCDYGKLEDEMDSEYLKSVFEELPKDVLLDLLKKPMSGNRQLENYTA